MSKRTETIIGTLANQFFAESNRMTFSVQTGPIMLR
jgi:hypothetical protein